jgi:hypothetical protein
MLQPFEQSYREIGLQVALVKFIQDHRPDA